MAPTRQALAWVLRPEALMARGRAECGTRFTLHLPIGPAVLVSDPEAIRAVFMADPEVFRAGDGNRALEPVLGPGSLLLLDGREHLRRRRLVLPPFHGARLRPWADAMRDELMTLLLAGHETTATALSWAFELLFRHPVAYADLRARLDDDDAVDA